MPYIRANRPFLQPLKDLKQPEAVDIVQKMVHAANSKRPTATEVLFHPFFWPDCKKLDFLCVISDRLATAIVKNVQDLYNQKNAFKDWQKKIEKKLWDGSQYTQFPNLSPNHEAAKQNDTRSSRLIRAVRDWKHHYHELSDDLQKLVGPPPVEESVDTIAETDENGLDHNLLSYFTKRVPNIVMFTYKFSLKHRALIEKRHRTRILPYLSSSLPCTSAFARWSIEHGSQNNLSEISNLQYILGAPPLSSLLLFKASSRALHRDFSAALHHLTDASEGSKWRQAEVAACVLFCRHYART